MNNDDKTPHQRNMEPPTQFYRDRFPQELLARKLKAELDSKETKFFQKDGEVISKRNVIAWNIRQKARQDAHELRGDYPARKVESKQDIGPITVIVKKFSEDAESGD